MLTTYFLSRSLNEQTFRKFKMCTDLLLPLDTGRGQTVDRKNNHKNTKHVHLDNSHSQAANTILYLLDIPPLHPRQSDAIVGVASLYIPAPRKYDQRIRTNWQLLTVNDTQIVVMLSLGEQN